MKGDNVLRVGGVNAVIRLYVNKPIGSCSWLVYVYTSTYDYSNLWYERIIKDVITNIK